MSKVLIGVPSHDGRIHHATYQGVQRAGMACSFCPMALSALCRNFNKLYSMAVNEKFDFFVLHHSDIGIETEGWLVKMLELLDKNKLDVLSVVVPIKNFSGQTSTALGTPANPEKGLTLKECYEMPEVFTGQDCKRKWGDDRLMVNTGVLLMRMSVCTPDKILGFNMVDRVVQLPDGEYDAGCVTEDWCMSAILMHNKIPYGATTAIKVNHYGTWGFSNERL